MWVNDFIFQKYVKSSRGHVGGKESRDKTSSRFILKGDVFVVIYYDVGRYVHIQAFRHGILWKVQCFKIREKVWFSPLLVEEKLQKNTDIFAFEPDEVVDRGVHIFRILEH